VIEVAMDPGLPLKTGHRRRELREHGLFHIRPRQV